MKTEAAVVFIAGLVLTLAGVGSVEDSVDNWELGVGVFVSVLGLALFWCGVKMINSTKEQ
jgi:hypothetical protein